MICTVQKRYLLNLKLGHAYINLTIINEEYQHKRSVQRIKRENYKNIKTYS